jgi:hypothetical protein
MESSEQELESRKVAKHVLYVMSALKKADNALYTAELLKYPTTSLDTLKQIKDQDYGDVSILEEITVRLCDLCQVLPDSILYNGKNAKSRALADWWENHQKVDADRIALEKKIKKDNADRELVLASLTPREKHLLNL